MEAAPGVAVDAAMPISLSLMSRCISGGQGKVNILNLLNQYNIKAHVIL